MWQFCRLDPTAKRDAFLFGGCLNVAPDVLKASCRQIVLSRIVPSCRQDADSTPAYTAIHLFASLPASSCEARTAPATNVFIGYHDCECCPVNERVLVKTWNDSICGICIALARQGSCFGWNTAIGTRFS